MAKPRTVAWRDLEFIEEEGERQIGDLSVKVGPHHIERWQSDPDGRFKLCHTSSESSSAQLGRFFPSL